MILVCVVLSLGVVAYFVLCGDSNMDHIQFDYHGRFQYPIFHPDYRERESKQAKSSNFNSFKLIDPFSWLETPSPDRSVWLEQQRLCTSKYCRSLKSTCEKFQQQYKTLIEMPIQGTPFQRGNFYFYHKKEANQSQYCLWRNDFGESLLEVLNPNEDKSVHICAGAHVVSTQVSDDGTLLVYTIAVPSCTRHTTSYQTKMKQINATGPCIQLADVLYTPILPSIVFLNAE